MSMEQLLEKFTEAQKEQLAKCQTVEAVKKLADDQGIQLTAEEMALVEEVFNQTGELNEEELDHVAGGWFLVNNRLKETPLPGSARILPKE
ncbi:hypothetical protein [Anoxynatronum buryatiense]|uniref:Nif11 domain-containing protein n=1 Tax=Anoxynatronum buryatiense TaxID=489973 RepID=A0AA45WY66_9CLOT|nr:hypothetical protein [Anoxynatronum buryatiense]SMP67315.1 hypothetical protein SAMN06296020_11541 [Anoxynatronum buryatiense]